jgi:hypothetical protein
MPCELNQSAWEQLVDEDIEWLLTQPRTLERDHIADLLHWARENKEWLRKSHELQIAAKAAKAAKAASRDRRNDLPRKFTNAERDAYKWLYDCGVRPWTVDMATKRVNTPDGEHESLVAYRKYIEGVAADLARGEG